jgi:hypothetical protein
LKRPVSFIRKALPSATCGFLVDEIVTSTFGYESTRCVTRGADDGIAEMSSFNIFLETLPNVVSLGVEGGCVTDRQVSLILEHQRWFTFAEVHFPNGENLYLPTGRQLDKLVRLLGRRARKKNQDKNEEFERGLLPDTP